MIGRKHMYDEAMSEEEGHQSLGRVFKVGMSHSAKDPAIRVGEVRLLVLVLVWLLVLVLM